MTDPAKPHLSESAIVGTLSNQILDLQDENKRLRAALADCGTAVGGIVAPQCSLAFLECVSQEVRLVTERLRRERADALQDAERAREQRNRVGVEIRRELMSKTNTQMAILLELEEAIRHDREIFAGTSDETNPMGQLVAEALAKLDAARKS